ncbi:MAG TPA: helix-hairpin-helix domain-containing protein [Planctomycetota bacterium]|nr:helix-hairpin-helix domain-containing protein [Planctomycetota bacterium]
MRTSRHSPPLALALFLAASAAVLGALALAAHTRPAPPAAPAALLPDLNTSPERHLLLLPGIGPLRARAIVEERANGPFSTVADLARVRGIGPATTAALAPLVRTPGEAPAHVREGDP